jgi:hypothetical protein
LYRITFCLGDLRDPELARQQLLVLLGGLVDTNVLYLRTHPTTPSVRSWLSLPSSRYDDAAQGVQPPGQEAWQDIPTGMRLRRDGTAAMGNRDLAAWRAAELIAKGIPASLELQTRPDVYGRTEFRAVVRHPNGTLDDPSSGRGFRAYEPQERVTFVLDLFSGEHERRLTHATLNVLLHALTYVNVLYLRRYPATPSIAVSNVRYMEEPPGMEEWQDIPTSLRIGELDCEDASCWRAAELQVVENVDAVAVFRYQLRKDGSYLYHILTQLPDGTIEDWSRVKGMR